jgi:hypothetical protein
MCVKLNEYFGVKESKRDDERREKHEKEKQSFRLEILQLKAEINNNFFFRFFSFFNIQKCKSPI